MTTRRNLFLESRSRVSKICLSVLYTEPARGIACKNCSPKSSNQRPAMFLAIKPMTKIDSKGTANPTKRLRELLKKGSNPSKGLICLGIRVKRSTDHLATVIVNQIVVAKGITTKNPAIKSFLRSCLNLCSTEPSLSLSTKP